MEAHQHSPERPAQEHYAKGVDIVGLFCSEFGSSPAIVRMQVGSGKIELDGAEWDGDKYFIPYAQCKGKWISVIGPERSWRLKFDG